MGGKEETVEVIRIRGVKIAMRLKIRRNVRDGWVRINIKL